MTGSAEESVWVLMPPEFEYMGGLFLPDLDRAVLTARLARMVSARREQGMNVFFDPGASGFPASKVARETRKAGAVETVVAGTMHDRTAADTLRKAARFAGMRVSDPFLSAGDGYDIVAEISKKLEASAKTIDLSGNSTVFSDKPAPVLLMVEKGEDVPRCGVVFEKKEHGLVRVTRGRAGSIPAWVNEIFFIRTDIDAPAVSVSGRNDVLHAFLMPYPSEDNDGVEDTLRWIREAAGVIERAGGPERFRLAFESRPVSTRGFYGSACWALRYGMGSCRFRASLMELVKEGFPRLSGLFHCVLGFYETGVDPLEEMYAGCALPERNDELIENIVP